MAERRKNEEDLQLYRVTVQVSMSEKEALKKLGKREGLNVSDYIRRIALYEPYAAIFGRGFNE